MSATSPLCWRNASIAPNTHTKQRPSSAHQLVGGDAAGVLAGAAALVIFDRAHALEPERCLLVERLSLVHLALRYAAQETRRRLSRLRHHACAQQRSRHADDQKPQHFAPTDNAQPQLAIMIFHASAVCMPF